LGAKPTPLVLLLGVFLLAAPLLLLLLFLGFLLASRPPLLPFPLPGWLPLPLPPLLLLPPPLGPHGDFAAAQAAQQHRGEDLCIYSTHQEVTTADWLLPPTWATGLHEKAITE
jgi:hypothetical protein